MALLAKPARLSPTTTHRRRIILRTRSTTEAALSTASAGIVLTIPNLRAVATESTPATTHHGGRATEATATAAKSLAAKVAGTRRRITLWAKPARLSAAATHRQRTPMPTRSATEAVLSTASPSVALPVPAPRAVATETAPATSHHRWRAACPAAASAKCLPTEVAGTRRRITLRSKPAILSAAAAHRRGTTLRARPATEPILSTRAIAATRRGWLDGLVAEFSAPALHQALAGLLRIEVPRGRTLRATPARASFSPGHIPAAKFGPPALHQALNRLPGVRVPLGRVVLSAKVQGAEEQRRRSHRT